MGQELPVTSYALLGLLTFGDELTGYELKQRADVTLRFYWTAPAMSQVYTELGRLASEGLVSPVTEGDRGRTTRYRITARGRRALRTWMEQTPAGFPVLGSRAPRRPCPDMVDPRAGFTGLSHPCHDVARWTLQARTGPPPHAHGKRHGTPPRQARTSCSGQSPGRVPQCQCRLGRAR
jgi:DNA-binding PadR family transcriptional regulator